MSKDVGSLAAIRRIGAAVASTRDSRKLTQEELASKIANCTRSNIAHLEQGGRLPSPDILEAICTELAINRAIWEAALAPDYLTAMEFQYQLGELLGKTISLEQLDPTSQRLAVDQIADLFTVRMSVEQCHAHFNSTLTFYGEKAVSRAFFEHFLGHTAFSSIASFKKKVIEFQSTAIRLFGSFRYAYKTLRDTKDIEQELRPLEKIDETLFTTRRPFTAIKSIAVDRLDDLGYIAVERVRLESRERNELATKLRDLGKALRADNSALTKASPKTLNRVRALLRKFDSRLDLSESLFSGLTADILDLEAERVAPKDANLARIEETQDQGLRNLAAYLSEPYLDVYVATSMRERADFVSVNNFVETVFSNKEIAHLHLRYFNPTQSWIADRVAKGLVEALMLRRAQLTVYMAQKSDTFGKDSEASVALGQGKPVIVYVPKLSSSINHIDSEQLWRSDEVALAKSRQDLKLEEEDGIDHQAEVQRILLASMNRLSPADLSSIYWKHWADFDLLAELKGQEPELISARLLISQISAASDPKALPTGEEKVTRAINEKLVSTAVNFEKRAKTFREVHPLALQVILSTGVLNGILVVRDSTACATVMHRLITNHIETDLGIDDDNYKLTEKITGSTLRVISKHRLLTNAFWTQYFPEGHELSLTKT